MTKERDLCKCDLICSNCGEVLLEGEMVEWTGHEDLARSEARVQLKVKQHECFKEITEKMPAIEQRFEVNQWVLNTRNGDVTLIKDQVLADLMNEQRAQGINKHLQVV